MSITLIACSFCALLYNDFINHTFWYDEAYTIAMMKYSYSEVLEITSNDVHPPLYYYMLKAFNQLFSDNRHILRVFSALGVLACYILALYPIKRLLGKEISFIFILLVVIMPTTQYLGGEIRMYSWAMFFVLGCSLYAYEAYETTRLISFAKITIFAVFAIYTHYYALIAVGVIYILLWVSILKKREGVVRLILFTLILIMAYSPWIPILIGQMEGANGDSWIKPLTAKDMLLFCYYFFSPKEPSHPYTIFSLPTMSVALSIMLMLIAILIFFIVKLHSHKPDKKLIAGDAFFAIFVITLFITFAISFAIQPISVPRYTNCMLGPLLLGVSIYVSKLYRSNGKIFVILSMVMLFTLSVARLFSEREYYKMKDNETTKIGLFFDKGARKPDVMIANINSYPILAETQIMYPERKYILESPNDRTNYLPFGMDVVDNIPNVSEFFYIQSIDDTASISNKYSLADKLQLEKFSISLFKIKD